MPGHKPTVVEYEGTISPSDLAHNIEITTGDRQFPVRVIHYRNIISIDDEPPTEYIMPTATFRTKIKSRTTNKSYTVTFDGQVWKCTCPGFHYRSSCWHIGAADDEYREQGS